MASGTGRRSAGRRRPLTAVLSVVACGVAMLAAASTAAARDNGGQAGPAGTAFAWGFNGYGEVGDASFTDRYTPVPVLLPTGVTVTAIAGGFHHSLALTSDGQVYAWGNNTYGQVGNGTTTSGVTGVDTPVLVHLPSGVKATAIAAGSVHSLALTSTGQIYAWGLNTVGQLGNGSTDQYSDTPVLVSLPAGVTATAIAAGQYHNLALTSNGLYAWGDGGFGEIGDGNPANHFTPVHVSLPGVTAIAAGGYFSLALTSNGQLYSWGYNQYGQLGDGTVTARTTPGLVSSVPAGVSAIAAGGGFSLALTSTGQVWGWGEDDFGQLGNGTTTVGSVTPVQVLLPAGVTANAIAAGGYHSLALTSTGQVYAWGFNTAGGLGNGSTDQYSDTPVLVSLPAGQAATAIAAGGYHSLAIAANRVAPPTIGTSPSGSVAAGATVSDTATLSGANQPTGKVTFRLYGPADTPTCTSSDLVATLRGALSGDHASVSYGPVTTAGTYYWVAVYPGDANNHRASTRCGDETVTVTPAALDHLVLSPSSATVAYGQTQSYTATGYDRYGNSLGAQTGITYTISPDGSCSGNVCGGDLPGTHTVTGTKGTGVSAPSGTATLTVTKANTTTTLTESTSTPGLDQPVTYTATVAPVTGTATPTGTVTFTVDGNTAAVVSLNGSGQASYTAIYGAGAHTVTATYSGDVRYQSSSSGSQTATVGCTTTVTGRMNGFAARSGLTCVVNATVTGAITVLPGAALDVENSTVSAPITSAVAAGLRVCGSTTGDITVSGSTGFVLIGDPSHGCAANTVSRGVIVALGNTGGLVIVGNTVPFVDAQRNRGTSPLGQPVTVSGNHP